MCYWMTLLPGHELANIYLSHVLQKCQGEEAAFPHSLHLLSFPNSLGADPFEHRQSCLIMLRLMQVLWCFLFS